jgi:hypothetical protein
VLAAHPPLGPGDSNNEEGGVKRLDEKPWWTPADRAELDAFAQQLVDAVHAHRAAGCEVCAAGYSPCPVVHEAIERVIEWRDRRIKLSRAAWLRARQDEQDEAVGGRRT